MSTSTLIEYLFQALQLRYGETDRSAAEFLASNIPVSQREIPSGTLNGKPCPIVSILIRELRGIQDHIESDAEAITHMQQTDPHQLAVFEELAAEMKRALQQREMLGDIKVCGLAPAEIARLHDWFQAQTGRSFTSFWEEAFNAGVKQTKEATHPTHNRRGEAGRPAKSE